MFHDPGQATDRAVALVRELLDATPRKMRGGDDPACTRRRIVSAPRTLDATVLIATYNRSRLLDETLTSLAAHAGLAALTWEVIVIDNNSTDDTRSTVERHARHFPVSLRYLEERQQGRSSALNTGIAHARGQVLAFTDDDVRVQDGWLDAACGPLLGQPPAADYTGGPVRPIWEVPPPRWLDLTRG